MCSQAEQWALRLFILCWFTLMVSGCGLLDSSLKTYSVSLFSSDSGDSIHASISTTYNIACSSVFGGSTNFTQNGVVVSGTSGSLQILQNLNCTITIASFFDGTDTYTPTGSSLVITVTSGGAISSSGSLSSPPQYSNGSGSNLYLFLVSSSSSTLNFEYAYDPSVQSSSVVNPCVSSYCSAKPSMSSQSTSFNSTSISSGRYIWFSVRITLSGVNSSVTTNIYLTDATATFTSGSTYTVNVPDGIISITPTGTCSSTTFSQNTWQTSIPASLISSNTIFAQAVAMPVTTSLPGSITPVTYQARFYVDQPGVAVQWQWGAAVYTTNMTGYSTLGVKSATSSNSDCTYTNSDAAGTPETKKASLTRGATGNGSSQYTGSQTSLANATTSNCTPICSGTNVRCPTVCQAPPITLVGYGVMPNINF